MNPKRTAVLWFAGGLLALAVVLGLAATGAVPVLPPEHVVAVAATAGAASALLGERLYLRRRELSP
jgi:hypothetical protein